MSHREYISPRMESVKAAQIDRHHERTGCNPLGMVMTFMRSMMEATIKDQPIYRPAKKLEILGSLFTRRVWVSEGLSALLGATASVVQVNVTERDGKIEFSDENENLLNPSLQKTLNEVLRSSPEGTEWIIEKHELHLSDDLQCLLKEVASHYYGGVGMVVVSEGYSGMEFSIAQVMNARGGRRVPCGHQKITDKKLIRQLTAIMNEAVNQPQQMMTAEELKNELREDTLLETSRGER